MNTWIKRVVTSLLVAAQFIVVPVASVNASTTNEKEKVEIELKQTQKEIDAKLAEASEITIALDELAKDIKEQEETISDTEVEIEEQETLVEERYDYTAEQLKVMQKSEVNQNIVIGLFQSENFSDFINRLYTVSVLTNANEELLKEAHKEYEKLNAMKEELVSNKEELNSKKEETAQQKAILDEKLSDLKSTLAVNQNKLDEINAEEAAAKEKAAKEKAEKEKAKKQKDKKEVASKETAKEITNKKEQNNQVKVTNSDVRSANSKKSEPSSTKNAGGWMTFESTGYSTQQAGLSTKTATGINLLNNPRVIAVDPSQIPLNSLVEVEGMGVYVAGDTGGAINGRIIDVHFPTVAEAMSWGRRNVRIRILN